MRDDNSLANGGGEPSGHRLQSLKEFRSAGRGFWRDVSDLDWNDWHWQLKHRITTPEQLQRLMPMLTPEEFAGAKLANHKLALAITPYFFNRNHKLGLRPVKLTVGTAIVFKCR